jgi:glycosyltransferase involved in cell wall biosynthesis
MVQVHQFHPSIAYGDAIGNSIQELKNILTELGYESEIFGQYNHPKIPNVKKYSDYSKYSSPDNILILHYSIAYDPEIFNFFKSMPDKKILIYHNITPSEFFRDVNDTFEYFTKLGRDELSEFKNIISIALGDSRFNEAELRRTGFKTTDVLPIPINFKKLEIAGNSDIIQKYSDDLVNILTVARISPNKKIEDTIKAFYYYNKAINPKSRLFIVGSSEGMNTYYSQLRDLIDKLQLTDVYFTGHITFEDLVSYYRISHIFITLSEHEGFCVPLLESMYFGIPVVAYNSTAIPFTMGNAGILINKKDPLIVAELLNLIIHESTLREKIVQNQKYRLEDFDRQKIKEKIASIVSAVIKNESNTDLTYQIEGPFDSSYSLALVNREMALALNQLHPGKVSLFSTEGPGDFEPNSEFLSQNSDVDELWKMSKSGIRPYVVSRNLYPPRVTDVGGVINILNNYGWEESIIPPQFVQDFNQSLDGIAVTSDYVKKVLIDNGVFVPTLPIGDGVDHICKIKPKKVKINLGTKFKFLHISSGFPRKGIDILLKAYSKAFSKNDNVTLIIKTFPNMHNKVEEQIKKIQQTHPECAEIYLINEDLDYEFLIDLYHQSDVLVAPSRGEGFGLPMAEAMLMGLPVITTGFGGQCDFCNDENSWLINYSFKKAETHMQLDDSIWVEPDVDHLSELMQTVKNLPKAEIEKRTYKAQQYIQKNFKWIDCASRLDDFIKYLDENHKKTNKKIKLGWVTSWNTKCGIASYSKFLIHDIDATKFDQYIFSSKKDTPNSRDEAFVIRCWENNTQTDLSELLSQIINKRIEVLIVQFNFGFFDLYAFDSLINSLLERKVKVIIFFHATADIVRTDFTASLKTIAKTLKKVDRLFVHGINDLNQMKEFGLINNVSLFPQGVLKVDYNETVFIKQQLKISNKKIIGSYGFLLPDKGIKELILAFGDLLSRFPHMHLLLINALYPIHDSIQLRDECLEMIGNLKLSKNVTMINDYLTDQESILLLKCADIIIFPYQNSQESSSAAVRHGIASQKPVVCTPLPVFNDVNSIVHILPGILPHQISSGLSELLDDEKLLLSKMEMQKEWINNHSWDILSRRLQNIIQSIKNMDV